MKLLRLTFIALFIGCFSAHADHHAPLSFEGTAGKPGNGKHIVLIAGDEEYRSEESCPMLAKILSKHHGFKTTVLFSMNAEGGYIDPNAQGNIPHTEVVKTADLVILGLRFRDLPDNQLQPLADYLNAGKPLLGFRTSTHAFKTESKLGGINWGSFGPNILGEGWAGHYGRHRVQGARGEIVAKDHPILTSVSGIFAESDVYGVNRVTPKNATILVNGIVTETLLPDSKDLAGKKPQPAAWLKKYKTPNGKPGQLVGTTFGASSDLMNDGLRRLFINSAFFLTGLDVPAKADVSFVDPFVASEFAFIRAKDHFKKLNHQPSSYGLGKSPRSTSKTAQQMVKESLSKPKEKKKKPAAKKTDNQNPNSKANRRKPAPTTGVVPPVTWSTSAYVAGDSAKSLNLEKGSHITMIGGGLGSRMGKFGFFETQVYLSNPEADLTIRNMCDEGHTPGHRQQPGRSNDNQFAFPGAEKLVHPEFQVNTKPQGHYETPDQWLARHRADVVIGFFGFSSSFYGADDVERFKKELAAFIKHTRSQKYNNKSVPQLALVTPTAFQDLSAKLGTPDGVTANANLDLYSKAMLEVAAAHGILCIDAFTASKAWYASGDILTTDGALLNAAGYQKFATFLNQSLFAESQAAKPSAEKAAAVQAAVEEKNWAWHNDYKVPNGVHVYGRRYAPYGPQNYPDEIKKTREMILIRDNAIWATLKGQPFDLAAADAKTHPLGPVSTNYKPSVKNGTTDYKPASESVTHIKVPEGYKVEVFASEKEFPNLANPCQMSFDNKGRLWVSTMPSYPHYRIGDALPTDCLIIYEDTDNDGKADKETVFADDLHLPIGFEFSPEGVYVSQGDSLVLLKDLDGDDKYDTKEILLSGFDDHDTHHNISAFCADPSGAIVMGEGIFLHTSVETAYGTVRGSNGGFYRYAPQRKHLMRYSQYSIPNPWGVAFDDYGQDFFLHTSGPSFGWMLPGTVKARYGANMKSPSILTSKANSVRPTSGVEFVSSRHFPDEVQGDVIINNNIGYLGAKQHKMVEGKTGFSAEYRQDLFSSKDGNFRPVDLEFAPDGSLYFADWHNVLIGHMQHNARDPYRDHVHGRIYRITYPSRPLVTPAKVAGASIDELLENLKLPEYRTRYRTRRELRGHDASVVTAAAAKWAAQQSDEHAKLEALWVTWGVNKVDQPLLEELLAAKDHRVRSAAVRVLRFNMHAVANAAELLSKAAGDEHGRVRLEVMTTASYLPKNIGLEIVEKAKNSGLEDGFKDVYKFAVETLNRTTVTEEKEKTHRKGILRETDKVVIAQVNCLHEAIKFDVATLAVPVGKKLRLIFNNPDVMQHNLVIVKPGTADAVATAAISLGGEGFAKQFVPDSDDILAASKLLMQSGKQTLEVTFDKPGKYPFLCTFPGHATMMRGHIIVK